MNFICDSSTLIALAETCTLPALYHLKQSAGARFLVPPAVGYETMQHPEHIKRFAFSAFKIEKVKDDGVLEMTEPKNLGQRTRDIMQRANSVFSVNGQALKVLHAGEAECLAVYLENKAKAVLVDEKTTRLLIEDPLLLRDSLQQEYHGRAKMNDSALDALKAATKGMVAVRSTEILAMAYEDGFFKGYGKNEVEAFHASLYALRNAGCSITTKELLEYQQIQKP